MEEWMLIIRRVLIFLGILALVFFVMLLSVYLNTSPLCENDIRIDLQNPAKNKRVVAFVRNCGTTTFGDTNIILLNSGDDLSKGAQIATLKSYSHVEIMWKDNNIIEIKSNSQNDFIRREKYADNTEIIYGM